MTLPISVHAQFNYYTTDNGTITIKTYTGPGGEVTIPDNINGLLITSIWDWAFYDCTNLTNVTIPGHGSGRRAALVSMAAGRP